VPSPPIPGLLAIHAAYHYNRARFALLKRALAERVRFGPECDIWTGCFKFRGAGKAELGPGCVIERGNGPTCFEVEEGGLITAGERVWFRTKYRSNVLTCFKDGRINIGGDSFINGAVISARESVTIGRKVMFSWDTAVMDSNLHDLCEGEKLRARPVEIGDNVLIGTGAVVLAGAKIGSNVVIGARSVVTGRVPDNSIAAGAPARVLRSIEGRGECS